MKERLKKVWEAPEKNMKKWFDKLRTLPSNRLINTGDLRKSLNNKKRGFKDKFLILRSVAG